jgi:predicted regulator of Ras-like GTPase activity (Roadblock/LC7/MglB family)
LPISPTPTPRENLLAAVPVARVARPAQPVQPAQPAAPALSVSLSTLAQGWPDALRQEIVQLNLTDARLALPTGLVEAALKRGRVVFAWKMLRSWIRPTPPTSVSAHDGVELELPLSVLAPAFIARQKAEAKPQQRVVVDETIPNLFFGLPQAEPATAPATAKPPVNKVVDTNYYVWDDVQDTAHVDESEVKRKTPTGTDFVIKYATPNEIVSRAAALDGVAGVLIALPDGLMVASRIPPELNGDTLAAFLPQIFAKVSQTTKELRMGELNNLNFTVGNVPWKIFRVNAIFFAAFGRVGEAMPTAPLAALAAELDRKNK